MHYNQPHSIGAWIWVFPGIVPDTVHVALDPSSGGRARFPVNDTSSEVQGPLVCWPVPVKHPEAQLGFERLQQLFSGGYAEIDLALREALREAFVAGRVFERNEASRMKVRNLNKK